MEAFRHLGHLLLDLLISRDAKIIKVNMCAIALVGVGSGVLSFPPRDTEIEPLPILEISDTEEVFLPPNPPKTEEERQEELLSECDATVERYADICAETTLNKDCNIWMYHAQRCNRWRNPKPASIAEDTGESEEISPEEIAMTYGVCTGSMCWGNISW